MGKGHAISGVALGLLASPVGVLVAPGAETPARSLALAGAFSGLVALGAILPDIDHKPAMISKLIPGVSQLACWVMRHVSQVVYQATRTEQDKPHGCHRTFTHTIVFAALCGAGAAAILLVTPALHWATFVGLGLSLGCLVHLLGDALTLSGIPLFWPLLDHHGRRWGTHGLRWFRAGGPVGEKVATLAFTALAVLAGGLVTWAGGAPWWSPVFALVAGQ